MTLSLRAPRAKPVSGSAYVPSSSGPRRPIASFLRETSSRSRSLDAPHIPHIQSQDRIDRPAAPLSAAPHHAYGGYVTEPRSSGALTYLPGKSRRARAALRWQLACRVAGYVRPYRRHAALAVGCAAVEAALALIPIVAL